MAAMDDSQSPPPHQLPVINFSDENLRPRTAAWLSTRRRLRLALEEYGCFMAQSEKVSPQLHEEIFKDLEELFDLPKETKMKNVSDRAYLGYLSQEIAAFVPALHESLGIDSVQSSEAVDTFIKLLWPSGNHQFCERVISFSKIVSEMEELVKRMLFESYGVEKYCDSHIASTNYQLKTIKYRLPQKGEENIGAYAHTDKSFFTILHQNEVNGLQVKPKNGDWLEVQFSPNSFLVMAGDACLAWSNGRIHSATHRVIIKGSKERYSIGLFSFHKGIIEIPRELVDDELYPLRFKPFNHYGLLDYYSTLECPKLDSSAKSYCGV